jgi:hypothetical protein
MSPQFGSHATGGRWQLTKKPTYLQVRSWAGDTQELRTAPRLPTASLEAETTRRTPTTGRRNPGVALTGETKYEGGIVGHAGFYIVYRVNVAHDGIYIRNAFAVSRLEGTPEHPSQLSLPSITPASGHTGLGGLVFEDFQFRTKIAQGALHF